VKTVFLDIFFLHTQNTETALWCSETR